MKGIEKREGKEELIEKEEVVGGRVGLSLPRCIEEWAICAGDFHARQGGRAALLEEGRGRA